MRGEPLKGHLDLLLLAALKVAPGHGYGIIEQLWELSDGAFDLAEGTIYPALHRLERQGLVRSRWDSSTGRQRRVYDLTSSGRKALEDQGRDWGAFSRAMDAVLRAAA